MYGDQILDCLHLSREAVGLNQLPVQWILDLFPADKAMRA